MTVTPTEEQAKALNAIVGWYSDVTKWWVNKGQIFLLDGGAGTGKTTVAGMVVEALGLKSDQVVYGSYTAKAARVMQIKGMPNAMTLHRMLYKPVIRNGVIEAWTVLHGTESALYRAPLLIVDECSMVTEKMADDIFQFGVPTLVLGDVEGQLPPPEGAGAFTKRTPDFRLREPHRTLENSPINRLAWTVRRGAKLYPLKTPEVIVTSMMDPLAWEYITDGDNMVICGKHTSRFAVTRRCRAKSGFQGQIPRPGEPVICCRNDYDQGLINGDMGTIWRTSKETADNFVADLLIEGEMRPNVRISKHLFNTHFNEALLKAPEPRNPMGALFDWGYAITAHKAQGSEWDNVVVIDDQFAIWNPDLRRRWLYTAVTRASQKLIVLQTGK